MFESVDTVNISRILINAKNGRSTTFICNKKRHAMGYTLEKTWAVIFLCQKEEECEAKKHEEKYTIVIRCEILNNNYSYKKKRGVKKNESK